MAAEPSTVPIPLTRSTPVREAFKALAREGFVRQDARKGVVVFEASPEDVRENFEIRAALESLAAELAAKSIMDEELAELDQLLSQMRKMIRRAIWRSTTAC